MPTYISPHEVPSIRGWKKTTYFNVGMLNEPKQTSVMVRGDFKRGCGICDSNLRTRSPVSPFRHKRTFKDSSGNWVSIYTREPNTFILVAEGFQRTAEQFKPTMRKAFSAAREEPSQEPAANTRFTQYEIDPNLSMDQNWANLQSQRIFSDYSGHLSYANARGIINYVRDNFTIHPLQSPEAPF